MGSPSVKYGDNSYADLNTMVVPADASAKTTTTTQPTKQVAPIGLALNNKVGRTMYIGGAVGNFALGSFFYFYASKKAKKTAWQWVWRITALANLAYGSYYGYKAVKAFTTK